MGTYKVRQKEVIPMKETGALLRSTLEREARRKTLSSEAEIEAGRIIAAAELEAAETIKKAHDSCVRYDTESHLKLENELATLNDEYARENTADIKSMEDVFSAVCDKLSVETANRILRHE